MLYDEVKKMIASTKLSAEHKFKVLRKTHAKMKDITQTASEQKEQQNNVKLHNIFYMGLRSLYMWLISLTANQKTYNVILYSMKNNSKHDIIALMSILKLDMLPRFYVGCPRKCDRIINPSNLGKLINNEVCRRYNSTQEVTISTYTQRTLQTFKNW